MKNQHVIIAGGGIGGLACALALARAGQRVTLLERAPAFAEVGAGIQLGPNAMHVLAGWGLRESVLAHACLPEAIAVRDVRTGRSLSRLLLGRAVQQRYGQVYASVHRADLHGVLLEAVHHESAVQLVCDAAVGHVRQATLGAGAGAGVGARADPQGAIQVQAAGRRWQADALVAADGLWSSLRPAVFGDAAPRATGHVAYRTLVPMAQVPAGVRASEVGVWWGRNAHVVHYPVRSGQFLNLVVLSEQSAAQAVPGWACAASPEAVAHSVQDACPALRALLASAGGSGNASAPGPANANATAPAPRAVSPWQSWHLYDRPATRSWVQGRVALLGDAAHPMLPYLAQGAAMALEDAAVLASCVAAQGDWASALQHYQRQRKARCERVVATARRNGRIFHLAPPWSLARDALLALKGTEVLGMPWLYGARVA